MVETRTQARSWSGALPVEQCEQRVTRGARPPRNSTAWPLVALQLMCVSFLVSWTMELHLLDLRVLAQSNVWFQADPFLSVPDLVDLGQAPIRHPNSGLIIGVPLGLAQWVLGHLGVGSGREADLHQWLLLLVAPVAASVRTLATYAALGEFTRNRTVVYLLCLVEIASFQTIALGSLPESYGVSAACIALLYWLMSVDSRGRSEPRNWRWIGLGALAAGVTITNLLPFFLLQAVTILRRRRPWRRVLAITAGSVMAVIALNAVVAVARVAISGGSLRAQLDLGTTTDYLHWPSAAIAADVGWAMASTVLAPYPHVIPGREDRSVNPDYDFEIKFVPTVRRGLDSWWRALATVLLLAVGVTGYLRWRATAIVLVAPASIVLGYFLLHLFWGRDFYLYGLHWTSSLVWLLAGIAFLPRRMRRGGTLLLAGIALLTALNSWHMARTLLAFLRMS